MRLCISLSLCLVLAGCSGGSDGDDCSGCLIGSICYPDQVTNPDNPCQVCDPAASTSYWDNNDGAGCDDGVFCNGVDLCSAGSCSDHAGNPCGALLMCDENNDECVTACTGCQIDSACYTNGQTNPQNGCQICNTSVSTTTWQANDGASCDDGLFCTGADTCSGETCQGAGDPCDFPFVCWEDGGGRCCNPDDSTACNADGDVASYDSCGHELAVVYDCADTNGSCQNAACGCLPGWSGDNCDECDLFNDTVCQPAEKCTFLVESTNPFEGRPGCAPDGTVDPGDACTFSGSPGIDDCKDGSLCSGGVCLEICTVTPNSCPQGGTCVHNDAYFDNANIGLCEPGCDLYGQDCDNGETCYLLLGGNDPSTICFAAVPEPDVAHGGCIEVELTRPGLQGECCSFINTCDTGYGCSQPNPHDDGLVCARFCDPTGTLGTDDCASVLGAEFYCVSIRDFYSDVPDLDPAFGFCLDTADWGPPECWNGQQDADEYGVDCCDDPPGACPCKFPCG
jgi:hypothetical protein